VSNNYSQVPTIHCEFYWRISPNTNIFVIPKIDGYNVFIELTQLLVKFLSKPLYQL